MASSPPPDSETSPPLTSVPVAPSEQFRRGFLPLLVLLVSSLWAWWAAYDRAAASLRLALWLCAIGFYSLASLLPETRRRQLPALLSVLNTLLAAAVLLSLPLPFDSDTLGGILAVFLPFALLVPAPLRLAALLLPLAALLKTREYGAWIGLLTASGAWMLVPWGMRRLRGLPRPLKKGSALILAGAFFLGFLLLLWRPSLLLPLESLPIPLENLHTRLEYAVNTLYLIADYPLGGGFASFSGLYSRYILGIAYVFIESSHNLYLDLAQEQGIFALAAFVYLLADAGGRAAFRAGVSLPARAALSSLIVLAVHGFFEAPLYTSPALPLLLLPLALAPVSPRTTASSSHPITAPRSRPLIASSRYLLVLLPLLLLPLQLPAARQAQIELRDWPRARPDQTPAETLAPLRPAYRRNLHLLPEHFASHYRLGLIALQERDFAPAVFHLQAAYRRKSAHPGVRKALAYAYVWNGDLRKALPLLHALPEARQDLAHYARWWPTQGRGDLSELARQALRRLDGAP